MPLYWTYIYSKVLHQHQQQNVHVHVHQLLAMRLDCRKRDAQTCRFLKIKLRDTMENADGMEAPHPLRLKTATPKRRKRYRHALTGERKKRSVSKLFNSKYDELIEIMGDPVKNVKLEDLDVT